MYNAMSCSTLMDFYENLEAMFQRQDRRKYEMDLHKRVIGEKLQDLVDLVLVDLRAKNDTRSLLTPFLCDHLEPLCFGTDVTLFGSALGLPVFYKWTSLEDVNLKKLKHRRQYSPFGKGRSSLQFKRDVDLESPEVKKLFLLSDNAIRFAIAKGITQLQSKTVYFSSVLSIPIVTGATVISGILINRKMKLYRLPLPVNICFNIGLLAFWTLGALAQIRVYHQTLQSTTANRLFNLKCPTDYKQAAKEFYEGEERRGKWLREALVNGEELFLESGQLKPLWYEFTKFTMDEYKEYYTPVLEMNESNNVQ